MSFEIALEKSEKYSKDVFTAIEEAFAVAGSPTKFFTGLSTADRPFGRTLKYTLGLTLCLMVVEMPLMAGAGVDVRSAVYAVSQIFVTIILFFLYALCFHFAIAISKRDLQYVDTYKVVVYSSIWFLMAYAPMYLVQGARFKAMSESSDIINLGYYPEFRELLDGSGYLGAMNMVGALFNIVFLLWVYKGFRLVHGMPRASSIFFVLLGFSLMTLAMHYVQNPIIHHMISVFKG